ncbi:MAG: sulfate ABC transporter permease subunit CysW [Methylacidiphilales bacterium]|nr:sulfate ABC transporter permease subunit CysW [Candidatus Methylacidiphilales bacterium]MDW8349480.1 sulfate ABC transporter permease subunit CysW [Verrucomicrobiae bacterium]
MGSKSYAHLSATEDPTWLKFSLIGITLCILTIIVIAPTLLVFYEALRNGFGPFLKTFADPYTQHAIQMTFWVALLAVPINTAFGICLAWTATRYTFPGKKILLALIDLPISVSPVIAGLIFVLLYGLHGWFGPWLMEHHIRIIFAFPGILLATLFVTLPYVARTLIPLMQAQGQAEEEAALTLGANGWQIFWHITLPKIRWGLLFAIILCNARTMGEFGAVSVVSGHIRGITNTIPLHIEILHHEYHTSSAFALASLLAALAIATLIVKSIAETLSLRQQNSSST